MASIPFAVRFRPVILAYVDELADAGGYGKGPNYMVDKADQGQQIPKAPQGAGGSDSGIEVTPEMIEAGCNALLSYPGALDVLGDPEDVARDVYTSMSRARQKQSK